MPRSWRNGAGSPTRSLRGHDDGPGWPASKLVLLRRRPRVVALPDARAVGREIGQRQGVVLERRFNGWREEVHEKSIGHRIERGRGIAEQIRHGPEVYRQGGEVLSTELVDLVA